MKKETYLKRQAALLTAGQIDRRQFIMGALAAGVILPSAMTMADTAMAMANKGGTLKFGKRHGSTTDSLDPGTYENGFMTQTGYMFGNHLTEVGEDGKLRPELAESIEASDDATMWTFKLRSGVEFHNGKALTGEDVVASFNHHRGEDTKSAAKGLLSAVTDIKADGNNVTFTLEAPNADFPYIVSDYHIVIMPSADGKVDATAGIGTGPYIIENFEPGVRVIGKRNPNYFKENAAHADSVELISLLDVTARQNALMNGEVHAIDGVDPKTVALLGRNPNIEILERTGTLHYTFPMRVSIAPFDNYDLRMALKLAVNRQELVDKILLGHGAVGNDTPISPATRPSRRSRRGSRSKARSRSSRSSSTASPSRRPSSSSVSRLDLGHIPTADRGTPCATAACPTGCSSRSPSRRRSSTSSSPMASRSTGSSCATRSRHRGRSCSSPAGSSPYHRPAPRSPERRRCDRSRPPPRSGPPAAPAGSQRHPA